MFGGDPKQGEGVFLSIGIRKPQEFGKKLLKMMGNLYQKLSMKLEQKKKAKMGRQNFEIDV